MILKLYQIRLLLKAIRHTPLHMIFPFSAIAPSLCAQLPVAIKQENNKRNDNGTQRNADADTYFGGIR